MAEQSNMIPTKYPKKERITDGMVDGVENMDIPYEWRYGSFQTGCAGMFAYYMIEMSIRHPIIYILWYRWWTPTLLHEEERVDLDEWIKICRTRYFRPYWVEFSIHHPILYLLYFVVVFLFQRIIKFLTAPVKMISRIFKSPFTVKSFDGSRTDEKLVD